MAEENKLNKKPISADWFVQGVLTRIGDAFDRFTGRGWKPSSSLATSELVERLKSLVDSEIRENDSKQRFVPHNIELKMQWDKFSTDSETALKKLETELLTALVDHINDRRYYTYQPLSLKVKPDYFITGVKLFAGYDKGESEREASVDVTVPSLHAEPTEEREEGLDGVQMKLIARFSANGKTVQKTLQLGSGTRLSVGRTKENDLALEDTSVSKLHASILLSKDGALVVADTGSTNGTFIDDERIAYGKAVSFPPGRKLRFGSVDVALEIVEEVKTETSIKKVSAATDTFTVGEFEFSGSSVSKPSSAAVTEPSIPINSVDLMTPVNGYDVPDKNSNGSIEGETQETQKN